jgi:hypothetical protein
MGSLALKERVDGAPVVTIWGPPDMSVMAAGRRTPPTMPADMFGECWPLIVDLAEGAGAPVDYVALGFVAVIASLLGGKRRVKPFATSNWSEPAIIWAAAVGDPSSNKSPAIDGATEPLRGMERDHAGTHSSSLLAWEATTERAKAERAVWQDLVKAATKEGAMTPPMPESAQFPDEPVRRRLLVQDATPEAVGAILAGNPSGTLHLRDELAGWLLSFERYAPGGREFWLEAYGGRQHVIDRKGSKGPLLIDFNGVSVLGGIQPEKLSECLLQGADDGLVARFLWAWPDAIAYRRPRQVADIGKLDSLYRRLDHVRWGVDGDGKNAPIVLPLDAGAADLFEKWVAENQQGLDDAGSLYKGFCGKLRGTVLRLALVSEYVAWATGTGEEPRSISSRSIAAAADFVDEYAKPSALRVFGDAALPAVERNAAMLARHIQRHRLAGFNARQLRRQSGLPGLKDAAALKAAIEHLTDCDWLREAGQREGGGHGRRSSDYVVNPAVLEV